MKEREEWTDSAGRIVVDCEMAHESQDPCDSYIMKATYWETGHDVPDEELNWMTENYASEIYEHFDEWRYGCCE